jgi:hypothetical protein
MTRTCIFAAVLLVAVLLPRVMSAEDKTIGERWSEEKAWEWYEARPWINGCNYLPSYAGNSTECWQADTFDPEVIDKELALAESVGYNSIRVLMQYLVWENNPEAYKRRFATFLEIADKHGLSVMPRFFDDCAFGLQADPWRRKNPYLGKQDDPVPGVFFANWTPSPGHSRVADESAWPRLKKYVQEFLMNFKDDPRVLAWDLYNEPTNGGMGDGSIPLLRAIFRWAREIPCSQPITCGVWNGDEVINSIMAENSDIITFHRYPAPDLDRFQDTGRPVLCTEWMIRIRGSHIHKDLIARTLPLLKEKRIGSYSWGLVNGRSQAHFQWRSKPGTPEPEVWFADLFRDVEGAPFDPKEIEVLREVSGIAPGSRELEETELKGTAD